jgi:hypothetical protein
MEEQTTVDNETFLSNKRTALMSPGSKINDLYYSRYNSTVQLVECTYNLGRFTQSLNNTSFGATSNVNIPNGSFLGQTYLRLVLPALPPNVCLTRGWGYAAIDQISYLFGSSNVSDMSISGQSLWHLVQSQCETEEKASEMFKLGGDWHRSSIDGTPGGTQEAHLLLPFPWSNANSVFPKKEFDTNILLNPITIKVVLKQVTAFCGGTGVSGIGMPIGFERGEIYVRQGDLTDKSHSLRNTMLMDPTIYLAYPFIHAQSFLASEFLGKIKGPGGGDQPVIVQLQQTINADFVGMVVSVIKKSDLNSINSSVPSPFNYAKLDDVAFSYNGNNIFKVQGKGYRLTNMLSKFGSSGFKNTVTTGTNLASFVAEGVDSYPVHIDFSRVRSMVFGDQYQNVWRIPNQSLSFSFYTPEEGVPYYCYVTYLYNAVNEVQGTQSNIYFN